MAGLVEIEDEIVVNICADKTQGKVSLYFDLPIQLPKQPAKKDILFHDKPKDEQYWQRIPLPEDLRKVKSMEEWMSMPEPFRKRYTNYITQEYKRRRNGVWFYNNGVPTYITGNHYFFLQWCKIDIGYPSYLDFQRQLFIHLDACVADPRCIGQVYVKCRRSGYTNMSAAILVNEGTQVKEKL